jgi:hypothetical protein
MTRREFIALLGARHPTSVQKGGPGCPDYPWCSFDD